ncbi:MAG: DNA-processing protein DprA [Flavobacteriales bacterium]|nr:DNA-processing protein DprA [Flavobacteriales bacterium]
MNDQLLYLIALTAIPNIGDRTAKKLVAYCGSSEQVFKERARALEKIPGVGAVSAHHILQFKQEALFVAETEATFIEKHEVSVWPYWDEAYPKRLSYCDDAPVVIYSKGHVDFNCRKVISVVGTRRATQAGKSFCQKLMEELKPHQPLIISGLAFGIDATAHREALSNGLPTVGVLAHGLDRIYPQQHRNLAKEMLGSGGLLTEFKSNSNPDRENFPKRNRIIAGLSDLTVVIESNQKGGSIITAELANSYNRDVFAVPGRTTDPQSEGCNWLIKTNKAALIQSAKDIEYIMGWEQPQKKEGKQSKLFVQLSDDQKKVAALLKEKHQVEVDEIALQCQMPISKTAGILLEMEFQGVIRALPGKRYTLL